LGSVPRARVLELVAGAHALLHPSLHDSGGFVTLEAMAARLPVVCLDLGGPAMQVTPETGIAVPAVSPSQAVADLEAALRRLASDPDLRARMGRAGRARVEADFRWDSHVAAALARYAEVWHERAETPALEVV
ncbi:glycosyltransferase family 4 protein, partial [Rubrivirga sp.]|uniref:glycosyltransferase family 4 protein n=1 Tax=Rubrivirga sp. TaxID=1885344 RepID=UPI003C75D3A6